MSQESQLAGKKELQVVRWGGRRVEDAVRQAREGSSLEYWLAICQEQKKRQQGQSLS